MSSQFAKLNVVWFALGVVIGITPSFLTPRQQIQTNGNSEPLVVNCIVNSTVDVVCPKCPDATGCPEPPPCKQEPQKECPQIGRGGCTNVPIQSCGGFSITDGVLSPKPDLCTYINLSCRSANHQFGTTAAQPQGMMAMGHGDLMFMDFISARYPHLANFTELGTAAGITTFYFGVTARLRGGNVHTFDYRDIRNPSARTAWLDNMLFFQEDVLSTVNPKVVQALTRSPQIALLDNGNKAKETNMYIQYLSVGSVMITHDWGTEIFWKDIVDEINNRGFEKLHEDWAEYFGSHVRAFIRTSKGKI